MDGDLVPSGIYDLLDLLAANLEANPRANRVLVVRRVIDGAMRHIATYNSRDRARRNVAHHYDLNGRLYSLFLDRDRQYSCAYFPRGDETLEEAQAAKKRHIAAKLCLDRPDLKVLDIGSGWGGLALTLARDYGARVTGITLSTEQLLKSRAWAKAVGLQERVDFELLDYRALDRRFDRIVSVGMFDIRPGPLRSVLPHPGRLPQPRRRGAAALHRPSRSPEQHQSLDPKIHLSRRLHSRAQRGDAPGGAVRAA